jgi:hypothetical protein
MIESPLIQEIVAESEQRATATAIVKFLTARFGPSPDALQAGLTQVKDAAKLDRPLQRAALCSGLPEFEDDLRKEWPSPTPASTRGKRRPRRSAE